MTNRPQVVDCQGLNSPEHEQTAGMQRGEAFSHPGVWAGFSVFPPHASTGWHHHGDYATYGYITEGAMTVDFGPEGQESVEVRAGQLVYVPARFVHRETVSPQGGSGVVVRVGGEGPTVHNVEGPNASPI
jgi:uncharacterized RmlC-like cupin family protein